MFADTARFIGHSNMRKNLMLPLEFAPPPGNTRDHDGDNRLSRDEALTGTRANFDRFNGDGDDYLSAAEINADVRRPDIVFDDRYTINLGGQRVELIWSKNRHTDDLLDVYFPDHGVLFASDYVWINRMCCRFAFDERPIATWIDSIRALESLEFDTLINSHFESGTKDDLIAFRRWLEDLENEVAAAIGDGQGLEQMQASIRLEEYRDWVGYENQLPIIIESAYLSLTRYSPEYGSQ
jgi:glyoxylase-like metal-dependent hydrolase (beta-lactamase superfamily II)